MKKIGIITIHKINNYGSVLQAYALQRIINLLGVESEIIDYKFPNNFHIDKSRNEKVLRNRKKDFIKILFARALLLQHKNISLFVKKYLKLSKEEYLSPLSLIENPPIYDIYVTGSDQVWNPRYCYGDSSFFLAFSPTDRRCIAYAASFGISEIPQQYQSKFTHYLSRYKSISVRENSGVKIVRELGLKNVEVVLDPTLLLVSDQWNEIATPKRLIKEKYILCYFLNYSFDAFPYVDNLAEYVSQMMGYKLVCVARPPHRIINKHTIFKVAASPSDFLALVRDAEMVLTTSFHGTAFALNYSKPLYSIVSDKNASDSRQVSLLCNVGLESRILSLGDKYPQKESFCNDYTIPQQRLEKLRKESIDFLKNAIYE